MQARGLKQLNVDGERMSTNVAPHAGAWIETSRVLQSCVKDMSRLMQARGLKLGLPYKSNTIEEVAPHAGAWIETVIAILLFISRPGRASRRRVD